MAVDIPDVVRSSPSWERLLALGGLIAIALSTWLVTWWLGRRLRGKGALGLYGLERLAAPVSLLTTVAVASIANLATPGPSPPLLRAAFETSAIVGAFWLANRGIDVVWESGRRSARLRRSFAASGLLLAGRYLGRVLILLGLVAFFLLRFGEGEQLAVAFTALTAAAAFAARDPLRNAVAFASMVLDPPFHVGDRVRLVEFRGGEDVVGEVISVTLTATTILTAAHTHVAVSNVMIGQLRVENLSVADRRRLEISLPIPEGLTTEQIRVACDAIQVGLESNPHVARGRKPRVWISGFSSGMHLKLSVWLRQGDDRREAERDIILEMRQELEKAERASADTR